MVDRPEAMAMCAALVMALVGCGRGGSGGELENLTEEYIRAWAEFHPTTASSRGFHEYDGQLGARDPAAIAGWTNRVEDFLARAEVLEARLEGLEARFDRDLLEWNLRRELLNVEVLREYQRDPLAYSSDLDLSGLLLRTIPEWPDRAAAIVSRLEQFAAYLSGARESLKNPPRPVTETALRSYRNLAIFLREDLPGEMKDLDPALQARFDRALPEAVAGVEETTRWLAEEVLPESGDDYALGEEAYLRMLRVQEQFDFSIEELLTMGRKELTRLQTLFRETAAQIDPTKSPQEVLDMIEADHPSREELVALTQSELDELKRRVIEHELITIPEGAGAMVEAAPPFRRWNPAYIMTPGPFDPSTVPAVYFISPGEADLSPEEVESWLRGLNRYAVRNISVHEVYPGHYVDALHRQQAGRPMRKMGRSYAFGEGWAHYTEELFAERAYDEPAHPYRLAQIQDALLRVCRYMTSIGLHTQEWSIEDGTRFFVENAYVEEILARQQTIRGTFDPGYLFYTLGKLYIKQMREEYRAELGEAFTLKKFHDALFQYGSPPLPMVRARLLGD